MAAPKKLPPWPEKVEKKEGKKEPKASAKMKGKERAAGFEKHKFGAKAKKGS